MICDASTCDPATFSRTRNPCSSIEPVRDRADRLGEAGRGGHQQGGRIIADTSSSQQDRCPQNRGNSSECCDARWALTVNQRKGATVLSLDTVS